MFLALAGASALMARWTECADPLVCYHGGPVLGFSNVTAIFWGPEWSSASFAGDRISGMDRFFSGFSGSRYASFVTEYVGPAGAVSTYKGHVIDKSKPPAYPPSAATVIGEACSVAKNKPPDNNIYVIYASNYPAGFVGCGLGYRGTCGSGANRKSIHAVYVPNLEGLTTCGAQDVYTTNSPGLAAIANISGAVMTNVISDPTHEGWYDSAGLRASTKCARVFPPMAQTFSNGSQFYIWGVFSNSAYLAGTGLPNENGEPGCVY
jgi:hypothetical protein